MTTIRSARVAPADRKSTRLNSSHVEISYAVFCLKKKINAQRNSPAQDTNEHAVFSATLPPHSLFTSGSRAKRGCDARVFFYNDPSSNECYTLSLHDALPI